jgi:hypothetical protein
MKNMEKTYTQEVHFKIVIEGNYSCCNLWEEELHEKAEDFNDCVLEHVEDNIINYFHNANIKLTNLETIEEN